MRNIGLLFLGWIWVTSANAQPNHRGILRLYGTPHFAKLTDTATLRWLSTQMGKGIETIIYHRSPPKLPAISDTARWQLQYYHYYCEDGIVYSKRTRTNQFFVNRQAGQTATTHQVLSAFGVKGKNRKLLPYYPIVPGRFHDMGNETGMFETGWQPICTSKDWLVLRKVDSYPHGGATSYYKEYRYYFRRR